MSTPPSERTRIRRLPKRGAYDRATIDAILDEGLVCHLGFVVDGEPRVIPTGYARDGDRLLLHGSRTSASMRALAAGAPTCVTVTLLDGLVLARSAFHHSMDYRSVVVLGRAVEVSDPVEKSAALDRLVEHLVPGRTADARRATPGELALTTVVALSLEEASAKVRTGGPVDDDEDLALPIWAGVVPLELAACEPLPDPLHPPTTAVPPYAASYRRPT